MLDSTVLINKKLFILFLNPKIPQYWVVSANKNVTVMNNENYEIVKCTKPNWKQDWKNWIFSHPTKGLNCRGKFI